MEIKQYLYIIRKWLWLLILGGVIGGAAAFVISSSMPNVYQTKTRLMVSRALQQEAPSVTIYSELQLTQTYAELITADPILVALEQKLGQSINEREIESEPVEDSLLVEVTVRDGDPRRAAAIANTLAEVFINYNESIQADRYRASEESVLTQIDEIKAEIDSLQDELRQLSNKSLETQQSQAEDRIKKLEQQITATSQEIVTLDRQIESFFPKLDLPTPTSVPYWQIPTSTPVPIPTPTLSAVREAELKALQLQLDQQQELHDLYLSVYGNLLTLGDANAAATLEQNQQYLQTSLTLYQQILSNLMNNLENVQLQKLRSTPNVTQVEPASIPEKPVQPQPVRDGLLGALSGVLLMGGLAFLIEYLDDTLKTPEDINQFLHQPVIGFIAEMEKPRGKDKDNKPGVFASENPLSPITEAFRTLRSNLDFASVDKPLKTLLITSASPSEGKSTISVNLAAVIAQGERKVALVDTDLRRPTIHRFLKIANRRGLSDLFREHTSLSSVISTWGEPPIQVITSGGQPPNPTELLASERMEKILTELSQKFEFIIIDSPPAIVADPIIMAAKVDGVVLVIEPGKTKIGAAQVVLEQMSRAGARIIGVVMNPISKRRANYYTKYRYYSTYYYYSRGYSHYSSDNGSGKRRFGLKAKEGDGKVGAPKE